MPEKKTSIIIGAGPAGLTAAYELLKRTDIKPIVLEQSDSVGGISKTVTYRGNRIDIGGHRFFSKSSRVMDWWMEQLPVQGKPSRDEIILQLDMKKKYEKTADGPDPEKSDKVMLLRRRVSRIFFLRKFFDYPLALNASTFLNLGPARLFKIGISYLWAKLFPIKKEKSLEDFFVNHFGMELYQTFFKDYTQKVWGVPCKEIKPEWGAQRVKQLSLTKAFLHAVKALIPDKKVSIEQKKTETSLIEQFMYPKNGPGQLWEEVAKKITEMGGEVHLNEKVIFLEADGTRIKSVRIENGGVTKEYCGDYFISSMPVKDLIGAISAQIPSDVKKVSDGLRYRDFITVGLLLKNIKIKNRTKFETVNNIVPDTWIYIQERDVKLGRVQIFNNWSPYMVANPDTVWIGLEYFCNEGDSLWSQKDPQFIDFAIGELARIGIIDRKDVLDSCIIRMQKTYPAYFGTYNDFGKVKDYVSSYENLYLIGRNGMHRYNNMDHSMLTAMTAVDNIKAGDSSKDNIWSINMEEDYHESK